MEASVVIERVVLIKLQAASADHEQRGEIARHSREALLGVPGVRGVTVALAADERAAADWDLCLTVRFDTIEDIPGYVAHPLHRAYVDDYLRPRVEFIKAWNFEVM